MKFLIVVPLLVAAMPVFAAVDCTKAFSDPEINSCAQQDLEAADRKLNAVYQKVLADLKNQGKTAPEMLDARSELVLAQREWIRFREHDCSAVFNYNRSGSIRTAAELSCMKLRAEQRAEQLEQLFDL